MIKIIDAKNMPEAKLISLMKKPNFDEIELSERVKQGIKDMFSKPLTAKEVVEKIVQDIKDKGDEKLFYYTNLIDRVQLNEKTIKVSEKEFKEAQKLVDPKVVAAMDRAIANVEDFHRQQLPKTWLTEKSCGSMLGQKVTALETVGIYVPGGTAAYPSSVIMNAVPAQVAGVKNIIMCVPPSEGGKVNPYVLVAAKKTGVSEVFKMGGAQAVAALAFGTKSVPKVDKITGPGNIFVTLAKKHVYGYCDIDMLAGPSEILIIADKSANPRYLAADLLSQAEHDALASAILVTDSDLIAAQVVKELKVQLAKLSRKDIASQSLANHSMIIVTDDLMSGAKIANMSAPEHLEVMTKAPFELLPYLNNAGAIFLGSYSPEPLGDYYAGPNHVLPTGSTAKFYSVLNVETFMKKTSIIAYSQKGLEQAADDVIMLASAEGLEAHARSIKVRVEKVK